MQARTLGRRDAQWWRRRAGCGHRRRGSRCGSDAVGVDGSISIYSAAGDTHVVVEFLGWLPDPSAPSGVTSISGSYDHSCAVLGGGTANCWGVNVLAQLGTRALGVSSNLPVNVTALTGVVALAAGGTHTCALLIDRTVLAEGRRVRRA